MNSIPGAIMLLEAIKCSEAERIPCCIRPENNVFLPDAKKKGSQRLRAFVWVQVARGA